MRLIDADALMDNAVIHWSATTNESCIPVDAVDNAPTIDAVPVKRGMWTFIRLTDKDYGHKAKECSSCGSTFFNTTQCNYCPNCGARMDAERKDTNDFCSEAEPKEDTEA